jgi:hypothetical protein
MGATSGELRHSQPVSGDSAGMSTTETGESLQAKVADLTALLEIVQKPASLRSCPAELRFGRADPYSLALASDSNKLRLKPQSI